MLVSENGSTKKVSADILLDQETGVSKVSTFDTDKSYILPKAVTGSGQDSALLKTSDASIIVAASMWESQPRYIELAVTVKAKRNAGKVSLDDIKLADSSTNSDLYIVATGDVASVIYPDLGSAGQRLAVPPPTISGYNAFSTTSGSVSMNSYGNQHSGFYSGNTFTTLTPTYDYSAQTAANFHNLGVAIQEDSIKAQNQARSTFIYSRGGNLITGPMNQGETRQGWLFFQVPYTQAGPFEVAVILNGITHKLKFLLPTTPKS